LLGVIGILIAGSIATRNIAATSAGSQIRASISFEGLAALVRSPGFDRGAVVLVDPTRSTLQRDLPPHHAMLAIPMSAVKSGTPDSFKDAEKTTGVWELANYRVEFRSSANAAPVRPTRTAETVTYPRTAEHWRDVKWIVSMERLVGSGLGNIRSDLMTSADLRGSMLSARVSLIGGSVEATEPAEPWNQNEQRFLPLKGAIADRPIQQAATQRILYRPEPAATFQIVLLPSDGSAVRVIELHGGPSEIPITISNHTTMDTLLNHESPHQAVHFLAFYDLLATPAKAPVIPTSLVPYPSTRTEASPGYFCPGDGPMFTWSFEE